MKLAGLVLAGVLVGVAPALAQYAPRPPAPIGSMGADEVADIVFAMGLDPVGAAVPSGPFYVQRAIDDFGRMLRVTVDARRSQVIAIEAAGASRAPYGAYAGYHPQLAPPASVMAPQAQPPQATLPPTAAAPRRVTKSAAIAPQRPPVPRKRPASAPEQASAGSVEPVPKSVPPPAAPEPARAAAPEPAQPAEPALTPVAPLE